MWLNGTSVYDDEAMMMNLIFKFNTLALAHCEWRLLDNDLYKL